MGGGKKVCGEESLDGKKACRSKKQASRAIDCMSCRVGTIDWPGSIADKVPSGSLSRVASWQ